MPAMDYVIIPTYAQRLEDGVNIPISNASAPRILPKITTSLPHSDSEPSALSSPHPSVDSPSALSTSFNIPSLLLSSALPSGPVQSDPRHGAENGVKLLSTRNPLSIPITTANFRRFVAKVGPVFWLQDRIEEILLWKRGWKVTVVWMSVYAFLCYFPKLILLLPNVMLVSILLATYPSSNEPPDTKKSSPPAPPGEGSVDWQANLQAIQNLMGAYSDLYDAVLPLLPHLVHQSPHSSTLLLVATITLAASIPLVTLVPLRPVFLILGLATFGLSHPLVLNVLIPALTVRARELSNRKHLRQRVLRAMDDDRLEDKHWRSELREVELFENERWAPGSTAPVGIGATAVGEDGTITSFAEPTVALGGTWAKGNLRPGERLAWTRGRDGWSGVPEEGGGPVSSLSFSLDPGWAFVETEDWRPDLETVWAECGGDANGWVYSNDVWMDGQPVPREAWIGKGITRRRRWTRRVYWSPPIVGLPMP